MPILEAQNISKIYHKAGEAIPVLNNLHIAVERGEILVLIGPSGSGKSTLLNILGTLDSDFSGSLKIDDLYISKTLYRALLLTSFLMLHLLLFQSCLLKITYTLRKILSIHHHSIL